ncbi:tetrahydromethanopterin S-methyltransferase subunit A [Chloroflexota bacterium]
MLKVKPHENYPPEDGRYVRGNDYSPVAVAIVLNCDEDKVPPELEKLIRTGLESGAALAGTIQTANIGFEKMICNIVANPNIRYLILGGPESEGHLVGDALRALMANGVDEKKRIVGTEALSPFLYNLPKEYVERFRSQITLIDLQFQGEPETIRTAVWSCYQEEPVEFRGYTLHDTVAYPEPALSGKITFRVTQPWSEPIDDNERKARERALELMESLRNKIKAANA